MRSATSFRVLNRVALALGLAAVGLLSWIAWRSHREESRLRGLPRPSLRLEATRGELRLAERAAKDGRNQEAERHFLTAYAASAGSRTLALRLAEFYGDVHQEAKAAPIYDRLLATAGTTGPLRHEEYDPELRRGEAELALGRKDRALSIFRTILRSAKEELVRADPLEALVRPVPSPATPDALHSAAIVQSVKKSIPSDRGWRRSLLAQAIRLDSRNWVAYGDRIALRWAEDQIGDPNRTPALRELGAFRSAVESAPGDPSGLVAYADFLFDNGDKKGAFAFLRSRLMTAGKKSDALRVGIAGLQVDETNHWDLKEEIAHLNRCLAEPGGTDPNMLRTAIAVCRRLAAAPPVLTGGGAGGSVSAPVFLLPQRP